MTVAVGLLLALLAGSGAGAEFQCVRILFTSDLHARVRPSTDFAAPGLPRRELGGWSGLYSLIREQRTDACLLVDAGDFGFGSPEGDSAQGRLAVEFMNTAGYDAAVTGAGDFLGGPANLEILARVAAFPVLADPMLDVVLNRRVPMFRPYLVRDVRAVRVGVIGLTDPAVPRLNSRDDCAGLAVDDPVTQVGRYLPAVLAESVDFVVVVGHIPVEDGCRVADSFPSLALVICAGGAGSSEDRLPGKCAVPVVSAGAFGQRLGVADILFNKTERRVYQVETRMLNVEPRSAGDSSVAAVRLDALSRSAADTAVCVNPTEYAPGPDGFRRLGGLVAEAVRSGAQADLAVLPTYVLESGLAEGRVSGSSVYAVAPHRERLRLLVVDDTTLTRLVAPESVSAHEPAPMLAGADYFVVGDTTVWPEVSQVARCRVRDRKPGQYRVVTTEQWLERVRAGVSGRLLPRSLTEMWVGVASAADTLRPAQPVRLYPATPGVARPQSGAPVNINTANSELLQTLPGVGPKTAERIIEYRETTGRFKSIEEIQNVKGIGPKRYERIRALICVR